MTYEIKNVDQLETSVADLASSNQKIISDAASLAYIIKAIKENWENESGKDLDSILTELASCTDKLQNTINPVVDKYVQTITTLVAESKRIQGQSL